jgi:hypothetical protein
MGSFVVEGKSARTIVLLKVGQVVCGGNVLRFINNLWCGMFLEIYRSRYFDQHTGLSRSTLTPWHISAVARRLNEGIAVKQEALLSMI